MHSWREYKAISNSVPVEEIILSLLKESRVLKREELVYRVANRTGICSSDVHSNIHTALNKLAAKGQIEPAGVVGFWRIKRVRS